METVSSRLRQDMGNSIERIATHLSSLAPQHIPEQGLSATADERQPEQYADSRDEDSSSTETDSIEDAARATATQINRCGAAL